MKPVLKEIYSLEIDESLENYIPEEEDNFEIVVRLMIGSEDNDSADSYDITICTPKWIQARCDYENIIWGKNLLIVCKYDYSMILNGIKDKIYHIQGNKWHDIAIQISRLAEWEYEGYH
ncbi:immunity 8 family protein [Acinetobacter sp. ACZLY 512]|uniref:Imm8 family immunity protein n=1 Tax=Acinetobacter sp. ACZLY 512 TaxID=2911206 RepID=UPI002026DE06|nr:Imm8 family immunity protein [Acinetobacter sp. ACZLY 512]MCL9677371.1 immunity 8 family protein [Acinetobacter sp. ACZLY 512]